MMMRRSMVLFFAGVVGPAGMSACDGGGAEPRALVKVIPGMAETHRELCVSLVVRDAAEAVTFSAGASVSDPETSAAARAGGALCGTGEIAVEAACTAGAATATLQVLGLWDVAGTRLVAGTDFGTSCGDEGCRQTFTCANGQDVPVAFELTTYTLAKQGFFDVAFEVPPPDGAPELCYSFRVVNGEGVEVIARSNVCSSEYGNSEGGAITYVMPCDARNGFEDNVLTWWVERPEIANAAAWAHPCLAPSDAPEKMAQWTGGCVVRQSCEQNRDIAIRVGHE